MRLRLLVLWHRLRASLWAIPLGMVLLAAALAVGALRLELDVGGDGTWWFYSGTAKEATSFLATLLGSMITMGTLSLSLTMVVLTLAAQQLGPRLIHHFMTSRRTQASVGLLIATIVYLLLVLRAVHGRTAEAEVPNLAVTAGTALVLASAVALLLFTHHLARSIVADAVIEGVGASLDAAIARLPSADEADYATKPPAAGPGAPLSLRRGGYMQAVDHRRLMAAARAGGGVITLHRRPGQHLLPCAVHGTVSPPQALTPALRRAFEEAILVGGERTPDQDLEFQVRQLVEIALRALSSGVNDTYTALAAIDRLALSLAHIMRRGQPQGVWRDEDGAVRLTVPAPTFAGTVDTAFDQIRQSSDRLPAVLVHLVETLGGLASLADEGQRRPIAAQLARVGALGRRVIGDEHDRAVFEGRMYAAEEALARGLAPGSGGAADGCGQRPAS